MTSTSEFVFTPQPEAAQLVRQQVDSAVADSSWLHAFQARLLAETGTRLTDWIDHIYYGATDMPIDALAEVGFRPGGEGRGFENQNGMFPPIYVTPTTEDEDGRPKLGIKVESVHDFLKAHEGDICNKIVLGEPGEQLRLALVTFADDSQVRVCERHGYRGLAPGNHEEMTAADHLGKSLESFRNRDRSYDDPKSGFKDAIIRFQRVAAAIGKNRACDLFFRAERENWQSKNQAARIQYERQQKLGLGWANHDHHTHRCSRECFAMLIHFLETAGFHCRERFYAGKDAGWGAQVLEHIECGIVIFADVDMSEDEVSGDFAHDGLSPKAELGTVGLWCKLHGDSFLAAGMHHLECQFDFDASREQLADVGIETMKPFTDFPHLKQAFTTGERWQVPRERLEPLVNAGVISLDDAERFEAEGVLGSHLEILERNDGYKGFNQTGISEIILQTNPKNEI